jgi:hypothetical protein
MAAAQLGGTVMVALVRASCRRRVCDWGQSPLIELDIIGGINVQPAPVLQLVAPSEADQP